jgi:hypothetical protein
VEFRVNTVITLGSIEDDTFFDQMNEHSFLKEDYTRQTKMLKVQTYGISVYQYLKTHECSELTKTCRDWRSACWL